MTTEESGHAGPTNITAGNITDSVVAIGAGATAYKGLTVEQVAALVVELKHQDQPVVWDGRTPYLGLKAFQESDAEFFFGRESLVDDLLARVREESFIVLAGPSGSGKSSVARAGLFHALRHDRLPKSKAWLLAATRPGGDPRENLAAAIDRAAGRPGAGDHVRRQCQTNPRALHESIEVLLSDDPDQRFVLLVDQFEEIFTQTRDEAARAAVIAQLTTAAAAPGGRAVILVALRSDFVSNCAAHPELRRLMSRQFQLVGAMEPRDLGKAITLPALEAGADIDPALVKRIIDDMKGEPGALPLMSFALQDLFAAEKTAPGRPMDLTLAEYVQRSGIESALERHANAVFAGFSDEQQALARGIFSRLIETGQGRLDTRRTATFEELVPAGGDRALVAATVAELAEANARLVTTSGAGEAGAEALLAGKAMVTIAHEKLIDAWPWLRRLVDENRENIRLQNDIADAAREWYDHGRDNGYLYGGGRLALVEEQLAEGGLAGLGEQSRAFVDAGIARRRANARNRRLAMIGLAALTALAIAAAFLASRFAGQASDNLAQATVALIAEATARAEAETQEAVAIANANLAGTREIEAANSAAEAVFQASLTQSQALAIAAEASQAADPLLAAQLAIEAGRAAGTGSAYAAIQRFSPTVSRPIQTLAADDNDGDGQPERVTGATWNGDESLILTWGDDGTARVWAAGEEEPRRTLAHGDWVNGATWNGDESQILTWSDDGTAKVWAAGEAAPRRTLAHGDWVAGATWNEDESLILTWSEAGTAKVWAVGDEQPRRTLAHGGGVLGATWNGDESQILTWGEDGTAKVWAEGEEQPRRTLAHVGRVYGATWNGDESLILTWSRDGTAKVWAAGEEQPRRTLAHNGEVNGATWNGDESLILIWGADGTAKVWAVGEEQPRRTLAHGDWVAGATWNRDESLILTWGEGGTAKVWAAGDEQPRWTLAHGDLVRGATWNGDESLILTWGEDGTAKVWAVGEEQPRRTLVHGEWVRGATWNRDESLILTWSQDGTARVWDANSGREVARLEPDGTGVTSAQWNAAEDRVLVTTWGGLAVVYPVAWPELLDLACRQLPMNIAAAGWTRFLPDQPYRCTCADLPPGLGVLDSNLAIDAASCPLAAGE